MEKYERDLFNQSVFHGKSVFFKAFKDFCVDFSTLQLNIAEYLLTI